MKPETEDFVENQSTSFSCHLKGIGNNQIENIKWFRDNELLTETRLKSYRIFNKEMRIDISSLNHLIDNGNYYCGLTLKNGQTIFSNKIDVKIKYDPIVRLNLDTRILAVNETNSVNVSCLADSYPVQDIIFLHNGLEFQNTFKIFTEFSSEIFLNIQNVTLEHNGTYSCYLNDSLKFDFDLVVNYGPRFLSQKKNLYVEENQAIDIECSIEKYPRANIKWKHLESNKQINYMNQVIFSNATVQTSVLRIEKAQRNSTGTYVCFDVDNPEKQIENNLFVKCKVISL